MATIPGFQYFEGPKPSRRGSVVASQVLTDGDVCAYSNLGTVDELTVASVTGATTTMIAVYHDAEIATTDSDYASIKEDRMFIDIIHDRSQLWKANVETGTADQSTDVGYEADLESVDGITLDASTYNIFTVTKVLNASTVIGYFTA